jgi:hypothetical protein
VCDQSLLVASYEARAYCPYVKLLNETGEIIWRCLIEEKDIPDIVKEVKNTFDIPSDIDVEGLITDYIEQLHMSGYVLYKEEIES